MNNRTSVRSCDPATYYPVHPVRGLVMKIAKLMGALLLITTTGNSMATELYGGAVTGMTEAEIRELFPAVDAADNVLPILPGATKSLVLMEAEIFGQSFKTDFYFAESGLVQIVLVNKTLDKKRQVRKACTEIRSTLVAEYGDATTARVTKSSLGNSEHFIYGADDLVVRLTCHAPYWPLRMVFQSRKWMDEQSPFGLSMGMTIEELLPYVKEPIPEDVTESEVAGLGEVIVLEAPLSHVPQMPAGEGELNFRIRASKDNGLCFIMATLSIVEDKGMEYLFSKADLTPNQNLFGTPSDIGGMFGEYKFSFFPKPASLVASDMWVTTVADKLPGSIDKMVYVWGSLRIDGVKKHVESVQIQFTNSHTCGLSRDDLEGLE